MKRLLPNNKSVFSLLLALFLGMGTAFAYDFSDPNSGHMLYFNIIDATNHYVEITFPGTNISDPWGGFNDPTGHLFLPSSVVHNGATYTITSIGRYAFSECVGLTGSLTIPNTVTSIGDHAFYNCTGFSGALTIGTSVTSISWNAFRNCSGFSTVVFNATNCADYNSYNDTPFLGITGTLEIGSNVTKIPAYMFRNAGLTGTLTIPNSVTSIGSYAFYNCTGFSGNLTIPNSVTTIGSYAFHYCTGFHGNLTITNGVTTIQSSAFANCTGFTGTLTIPLSVTDIGYRAFYNCSSFYQVRFGAYNCADVTESARPFEGCGGALVITLNTQRVPANMFRNANFTVVTIRENVTSIGAHAFKDCSNLANVYYLADTCANLAADDLPFEGCGGTLEIGEYVERIPNHLFRSAGFTGSLTIPNSVTSIGAYAFYGCAGFTGSLTIGESVVSIGSSAFRDCSGFTSSLTIPNSVTTISTNAFNGCTGFTGSLTIGNSVTSIGSKAFRSSSSFSLIKAYPTTPPTLNLQVFHPDIYDIPLYVPCEFMEDYQAAAGWSAFSNYQCFYATPGVFSVSENKLVLFSPGNLQYIGSAATPYWKFADHQWDYFGSTTGQGSDSQNVDRDLFGWGTSGHDHGAVCYQPWSTESYPGNYYAYGDYQYNLCDQTGQADWGSNAILNGDTFENGWRTLTHEEWIYLLYTRDTPSGIRFAKATVNGINGLILLPDDWIADSYNLSQTNQEGGNYSSNVVTVAEWTMLEQLGAVFLPAAGYRTTTNVFNVDDHAYYWSASSYNNSDAWELFFHNGILSANNNTRRNYGNSVRLVRSYQSPTTQTVSLSAGTNWFSTNLEITLDDLKAALVAALPGTNIVIKSKTQNAKYNGTSWRGNLTWDLSKMYLITVESACEITLEGEPINPADHPATILSGQSNWIAFPVNEEMTLSEAFANFNAVSGDVVKSKTGNARYTGTSWRASGLTKLEPGKGYLFNSASTTENRTLIFSENSK